MTLFEKLIPFLVIAFSLGTGATLFFALRTEARLAARREINLENYREKSFLFYITRDYPVAIVGGAFGIASLVCGVIALCKPVSRLYAISLVLLLLVNAAVVYLSLTRNKFGRDIRIFDAYYVQVEHLLKNKARTQSDITVCRNRVR